MTLTYHLDFLFELFLSIRLSLTVYFCFILNLVLSMTHGYMIIAIKLHPINPLDTSNQAN